MTRILVDTNIFLDVLCEREDVVDASEAALNWCVDHPNEAWMAWHSLSNLHFIGLKYVSKSKTEAFISDMLEIFEISPTDTRSARFARMLPMTDFEDALQVAAAVMVKADFILTRNLKDYKKSPIPAMAPEEFVERFV